MVANYEDPDKWYGVKKCPKCGKDTEILKQAWDQQLLLTVANIQRFLVECFKFILQFGKNVVYLCKNCKTYKSKYPSYCCQICMGDEKQEELYLAMHEYEKRFYKKYFNQGISR